MAPSPIDQTKRAPDKTSPLQQPKTPASRKVSRRRFLKGMFGGLFTASLLTTAYARWVEPARIQNRTLTITSSTLPKPFRGVRIAHISDIHFGVYFDEDRIQEIVERVMAAKPDMICLTGDLVEDSSIFASNIIPLLKQLRAPLGQYAVLGNHDYERGVDLATVALQQAGFEVLTNSSRIVKRNGAALVIAGIDDAFDGNPNMNEALKQVPSETWCLLLAHEPDWADTALKYPVDLQLSGHSHGGQIRIPLYGPVFLPKLGEIYPDGLYKLERSGAGNRSLLLHTSRGLGTTLLPIRLFCPPEWTLITLIDQ
ncbi:metallophosphoesterase [Paenibacillus marinisediminis]